MTARPTILPWEERGDRPYIIFYHGGWAIRRGGRTITFETEANAREYLAREPRKVEAK